MVAFGDLSVLEVSPSWLVILISLGRAEVEKVLLVSGSGKMAKVSL